jgi:parallel beta-helix repeat protein
MMIVRLLRVAVRIVVISTVTLLGLGAVSPARAADCGGSVACGCGDTVVRATTLTADLGVCPGVGLKVRSGVVLDCAGHTLTGSDLSGATYGIHLDTATKAEVRNCRVTKFRRAIRVDGGRGNRVIGNEVFGNRYGIELAGGARGTLVEDNLMVDHRDEALHVGTNAHRTKILGNTIVDSKKESIYLLRANGCQVVGNNISRTDNAAIFIKHSRNAYVADNTIVSGRIHLRGDSVNNVLENNHLRGTGYLLQGFEEPPGTWTFPRRNRVRGGIVENTSSTCLRFAGAYDNRVEALHVDDECEVSMWAVGGQEPTGNVVELLPLP